MSVKTEYKCDKCSKVSDAYKNMWSLIFVVRNGAGIDRIDSYQQSKFTADWCRQCAEKAGLLPVEEAKPEEIIPLTIEDLVRDIVKKEMSNE